MHKLAAALTILTLSSPLAAQAPLELRTSKQNVVAGRIVGEWEPDVALTTRLGGSALTGASLSGDGRAGGRIVIRSDPTIATKIPPSILAGIRTKVPNVFAFLAGTITLGGKELPFFLTEFEGNMNLLYFKERQGDPFGDGESFIVTLAPAKEPGDDVLFFGGDFNNQPFSAFKRVRPGGGDRSPLAPF